MVWDRQDRQAGRKAENGDRKAGSQTDVGLVQAGRKAENGQTDMWTDSQTYRQNETRFWRQAGQSD